MALPVLDQQVLDSGQGTGTAYGLSTTTTLFDDEIVIIETLTAKTGSASTVTSITATGTAVIGTWTKLFEVSNATNLTSVWWCHQTVKGTITPTVNVSVGIVSGTLDQVAFITSSYRGANASQSAAAFASTTYGSTQASVSQAVTTTAADSLVRAVWNCSVAPVGGNHGDGGGTNTLERWFTGFGGMTVSQWFSSFSGSTAAPGSYAQIYSSFTSPAFTGAVAAYEILAAPDAVIAPQPLPPEVILAQYGIDPWLQPVPTTDSTVAPVNAFAEVAAGTGTAVDSTVTESVPGALSSGTGTAANATVSTSVSVTAGVASGTGTAAGAAAKESVPAGVSSGTGTAANATVSTSVSVTAGVASGTGTASNATVSTNVSANASVASGTGTAYASTAKESVNATLAAGTGTAVDATVSTSSFTNAAAGNASGTGTAYTPTPTESVPASIAAGTGSASNATATTGANVPAELAAGTGTAQTPTAKESVNAGLSTGTGLVSAPTGKESVPAGLSTGTGTASNAAAITGTFGLATLASGVGSAFNPVGGISAVGNRVGFLLLQNAPTTASSAPATSATGTGAASAAVTTISRVPGQATGTGTAYNATAGGVSGAWQAVPIGAGGWITGIDMAPDGTTVCRTDTYGGYKFNRATQKWSQLFTTVSMPVADRLPFSSFGCYEVCAAPSTTTTFYAAIKNNVYKSLDSGVNWTPTALAKDFTGIANDGNRMRGRHMVVDPTNASVVYCGIPGDGLYFTINGGTSWTKDAGIPTDNGLGYILAFDTASTVSGGRQQKLYCSVGGTGVYKTSNAGTSWTNTGGPTAVAHMVCCNEGSTSVDSTILASQSNANIYRWNAGAWATVSVPGQTWWSIAVNPNNKSQVVIASDAGAPAQSLNGGASFIDQGGGNQVLFNRTRSGGSIPWHGWTNEGYMSNGRMEFDPLNSHGAGTLFFAEGIGTWWTNMLTTDALNKTVAFTSMSVGIEQMVTTEVRKLTAGGLVVECADRPTFVIDPGMATYPSIHGPDNVQSIIHGFSCTVSNDGYIYALNETKTARSPDKGATWALITTPTGYPGNNGTICVDPQNHQNVVVAYAGAAPVYTTNGGTSWTASTGVTVPGIGTWSNHVHLAADSVTSGTFYFYGDVGLYKSTNNGATWTQTFAAGAPDTPTGDIFGLSGYNATIQNAPGTHDMWLSGGQQGGWPDSLTPGSRAPFFKFTSSGTVANQIPNVLEVYKFGFGKAQAGGYPALFIVGWVSNVFGVWRSDDAGNATPTWTNLGTWPFDSFNGISSVAGDPDTFGRVYVAFSGSGAAWRDSS